MAVFLEGLPCYVVIIPLPRGSGRGVVVDVVWREMTGPPAAAIWRRLFRVAIRSWLDRKGLRTPLPTRFPLVASVVVDDGPSAPSAPSAPSSST